MTEPDPKSTTDEPTEASVDRFLAAVEDAGGQINAEVCRAEELYFDHPVEGRKPMLAWSRACGWKSSKGIIPYERDPSDKKTRAGFVVVCAVCDAATQFPRFS